MKKIKWIAFLLFFGEIVLFSKDFEIFQNSGNQIRRVSAFLNLIEENANSDILKQGLSDSNSCIRRAAVLETFKREGDGCSGILRKMGEDPEPAVRNVVIACLSQLKNKTERIEIAKVLSSKCSADEQYKLLKIINGIDLSHKNLRLIENKEHDMPITITAFMDLPMNGWKFYYDKKSIGLEKSFFSKDFDHRSWKEISIDKSWSLQKLGSYGKGWYRLKFKMPRKPDIFNAVELHFRSVDTIAYVWVNGKFIGSHDEGRTGYNKEFHLDMSKEIDWDHENVLTVLAEYAMFSLSGGQGGGITKKITVEVLK